MMQRWALVARVAAVLAVTAGVLITAIGPSTVSGLLPYFTIQSNLLYAVVALVAVIRPVRPVVKGAATLYITITGVVYHLLLANSASPFWEGPIHRNVLHAVGNQLLHTVVPLLAVVIWLLVDEHGTLRWRYAVYWLAYPLAYLAFALIRGLIVHSYPYGFVDAGAIGYGGVAVSAVGLAVGFWLLGLALCALDGLAARRTDQRRTAGNGSIS
jgi:hypothetical protein